jgi:DnaJ-class molecular chaperone
MMAKTVILIKCETCHGTGKTDLWEGGQIVNQEICAECKGKGKVVFGTILEVETEITPQEINNV